MKILVTGGTGFLGKALSCKLAKIGNEVIALGRNEATGKELNAAGIGFIRADLADANAVTQACCGQDYVFHCGALSSPWGKYKEFYQSNVLGTKHIVWGCRKHGVKRLVYVSTPSIYMEYRDRRQIKENEALPPKFVNTYAQTKLAAENIVDDAGQNGLPVITIRPRGIFGPGDRTIFPRLIRVNDAKGIPDFGKQSVVDVTYIDNVVDALLLCLSAPTDCFGKKYNITNGEPMPLKTLLTILFERLAYPLRYRKIPFPLAYGAAWLAEIYATVVPWAGEPEITRYGAAALYYTQTLDITLAKQQLGYHPRVSMDEGIQRFADWWKNER